ncbi:hypothetical protein DYZ94_28565 [Klebsiella variicola]|nr:hypothetical protein C0U41_25865 [Klebsiella pneumoniae]PLK31562.1 hypothetical protein CYD38_26650 [Klebsiella variicola]TNC63571.1 hypothetical protein FHB93_15655 [Klebsiella quasipneumoniae]HAG9127938.1 hypothetical protein [Escherichia coli]HBX3757589.1 hypothetical protein [Klebsiella pneumoniae subsp. pneumoniae]
MQGFSPPFFDHREKSGSRCRNATDAVIRPRTGGMGPGEAAPANSSLCGCRAKVKARHSQHTARR